MTKSQGEFLFFYQRFCHFQIPVHTVHGGQNQVVIFELRTSKMSFILKQNSLVALASGDIFPLAMYVSIPTETALDSTWVAR